MALSPKDEEIASQYRKMLRIGISKEVVIHRMTIGAIPQHIQDAVLAGEDNTSGEPVDDKSEEEELKAEGSERQSESHNRSSNSFWEEEVVEEDELVEEVVVDDDEEILEEEAEFDEESFEEEIVEESQFLTEKEVEDSEYENQKDDNEADSDGHASTGAVPEDLETESVVRSNSPTYSNSNAADKFVSGTDVENQQQLQGYRPPPNTTAFVRRPPEKPLPSPSSCWYWVACLIFVGLIGAGGGVGYWLTTRTGDDVSILKSLPRTNAPTAAPSVSVSTEFDAVQGGCDFDETASPSPIDQCLCSGEITMIQPDIRDRYLYNLEYFIPDFFEDYNDELNSCTPRNQALMLISSGDDAKITKNQRKQRFALATVYASLGGSQWDNNTNWLVDEDVCTWYGVVCADGYVTQLVLDRNNLVGMLPSELSLLEKLQFLMVARNKISGPLPVSLFSIQALGTVDVGFNSITGVIPPAVGDAISLNSLNVEFNAMSGRLTKSIGQASNLGYLNLKSNQFAAEIPAEIFDLRQIKHLEIGDNKFSGTISDKISNLKALEILTLGPNLFTGTIPLTFSSLGKLRYLSIRGMKGLSGRIPAEFGFQLNKLEEIIISETSVTGNIDTSFGRLPRLKVLDFSKNDLSSIIPSQLGNLSTLVSLDLGHNFLYGQIPDSIGNIQSLERLKLNDNLLQGGIPVSFGNLKSLESIRLDANRLEDRVADEICDLRQDLLSVFVVDCPVVMRGDSGLETFGVVCAVPECCTECISQ
mmetsp:Transcript_3731/g.9765  ORF Transcript_3731/g.9765 Transcript_3731/m.9765 type:complete len:759 (+) Transcript_3731:209-2485(+)|eukprot:CAMPEP_0197189214 /NCGR_PEP_ID=MMETSP1423-20130617/19360_1 /TAXON_ID=476441 /ORGANISM="Pseudo-nitzschia heimii, Strain UNC1101" /LENGTH=758 /DNA_ID=CAMNT_0042641269 /DNA_START=122 /DNA_END=2398 /DNA_ORIENTATION=+